MITQDAFPAGCTLLDTIIMKFGPTKVGKHFLTIFETNIPSYYKASYKMEFTLRMLSNLQDWNIVQQVVKTNYHFTLMPH